MSAHIASWLSQPLSTDVREALQRLAATPDVAHIAVMPDVHLANAVCIGTVTATHTRLFPEAVGGDIGCGMTAVRFATPASLLAAARPAAAVLHGLYEVVPFIKHTKHSAPALPEDAELGSLSCESLRKLAARDGRLQLGTLGRGNHFLELQRDETGQLWLMVHSGSRAMGPAIREHHLRNTAREAGMRWHPAEGPEGQAYLNDAAWARRYARHNRRVMLDRVSELLHELFGVAAELDTLIDCDHNHVQSEFHHGTWYWVHRKGALHAADGVRGVIPGSMGSPSYHVAGRGLSAALCSSSHGAGRSMSRTEARRRIAAKQLLATSHGVWFDRRLTDRLREEAPDAYKNIGAVMRAQRELTRIVRKLDPVLVYKGG